MSRCRKHVERGNSPTWPHCPDCKFEQLQAERDRLRNEVEELEQTNRCLSVRNRLLRVEKDKVLEILERTDLRPEDRVDMAHEILRDE